jgi:hypothetical protein
VGSQLTISGTLVEQPPPGCESPAFPSGVTSVPFGLNTAPCPKNSNASTGARVQTINSPSAFVTLSGVGATDNVTQGDTSYVRVRSGGFQLRLTFNNPASGSIVSVLPLAGLHILECDAGSGFYLTKVELQGSGTVEFFASGQQ